MALEETARRRTMKLAVFMSGDSNYHVSGWRLPGAAADAGSNLERWFDFARTLEAAKFDMLFLADTLGIYGVDDPEALSRTANIDRFEPITLLSALSTVTRRLGLAATCATTYAQPFDLARLLASADLISGGRIGWNIVTGANAQDAWNYGLDTHVPASERYARGGEFVRVAMKLWESIAPDAFPRDKGTGIYADPSKIRRAEHQGRYYSVRGPLSVPPSPQGRPILIQAGQSEEGRALAAEVADVVFTANIALEHAQAFYADIKARAAALGRDPEAVKVMPGLSVTVAPTREEALEKVRALDALMDPAAAMARLQSYLPGIDLSQYDLDAPFPDLKGNDARSSAPPSFTAMARRDNLTLRQLALRAAHSKLHVSVVGDPVEVADLMQAWFEGGAADGFNLLPATVPGSIDDFIELVLPELRRRGLFRQDYEGDTLRQNLELPMPKPVLNDGAAHLVGSVPLSSVEEVFEVTARELGAAARRLPDGEAGGWVNIPASAFAGAHGLEQMDRDPALPPYMPTPSRLSAGQAPEAVRFPASGYVDIVTGSYGKFRALRDAGKIPGGVRFQASFPTPLAVLSRAVVEEDIPRLLPHYTRAYLAEVDQILGLIPHEDLAIQWDAAVEVIEVLERFRPRFADLFTPDSVAEQIAGLCGAVPEAVQTGVHLCYGNPGGKHVIEPKDTVVMADFVRRFAPRIPRALDWVHMPVPIYRDDPAYFAPLASLDLPRETQLFLGLVHLADGMEGARRRAAAAKTAVSRFGVGAECGLRFFPPADIPALLRLHREAAKLGV